MLDELAQNVKQTTLNSPKVDVSSTLIYIRLAAFHA